MGTTGPPANWSLATFLDSPSSQPAGLVLANDQPTRKLARDIGRQQKGLDHD
jgi:hypothetical protein